MPSVSQIAGFLNQLFLQNKSMKEPHFLHVDANFQKLKDYQFFSGWAYSKVGIDQSSIFWTPKLTVSQEWNELFFLHVGTNSCKLKGD